MTAVTPETAPLRHPNTSLQDRHDISLARVYLPFAMVIVFGMFLAVAGYTVGGIMSGIARDKTETEKRLSAIEKEVTAIKNILAERAETPRMLCPAQINPGLRRSETGGRNGPP
jgi:hypothetical protein